MTQEVCAPLAQRVAGTGWPAANAAARGDALPRRGSRSAPLTVLPSVPPPRTGTDGSLGGWWLRAAAGGLMLLAAAAAAVSFAAQYRMADAARRLPAIAGLEAAIPDTAALVFACLGVALAVQGRRAVRARLLNLAAVGTSLTMNALAAAPGWRDLAIWVMPPAAYALASDTLISVVRARAVLTGQQARPGPVAPRPPGGLLLCLARLILAPAPTLAGVRARVLDTWPPANPAPAAPAARDRAGAARPATPRGATPLAGMPRAGTKTARFLSLVQAEHGPLGQIPLQQTGRIAAALAPLAGLHPGSARTALRRAILTAAGRNTP